MYPMYLITFDKLENGSILYQEFQARNMTVAMEIINDLLKAFPNMYTLTGIYKRAM